ncbi:MAG: DNA mismatch repair endonuclease MutL, partial [Geobacter sp.]|nr:DNA mismatch repair endonuclease MutL [Geobacter sp.]
MSPRVRILPEQLANKIAAGEVVDRPASVIKELVENSLDAGATEVIVEIEDGGRKLIRVTDNGCGMSREDALVSLERHATSKIATDADLFAIASLGFRGEAIPSIASVSRFTLATREHAAIEGTEIYLEGGVVREVKACGMPPGTVITVRNLFFNTPARLKFMKSRETETGHIGDILNRLALARPDVRFIASFDGKNVMKHPAGSLMARGGAVFGSSNARELYPLTAGFDGVELSGLIGSPAVTRSSSSGLYTFLNGRFIRDRVVQHAVMQGYRGLLERGRYPLLALFITIPPDQVDVNVHPAKHEVRFRDQQKVHAAIQNSLEGFLASSPWLDRQVKPALFAPPASPSPASRVEEVKEALLKYAAVDHSQPKLYPAPAAVGQSSPSSFAAPEPAAEATGGYFSSLRIIGQHKAAYIICEDDDGLVIIDQHAAHERVVFEELRTSFCSSEPQVQRLLMPVTIDLQPSEGAAAAKHLEILNRSGFELEHFGGTTWLVSSVPAALAALAWEQSLKDILEELSAIGQSGVLGEAVDGLLARIACHSVVRGEWHLSLPEITALFRRMDSTASAANCPHGRPVI